MIYTSEEMELRAAMTAAESICAAARTAPKAKGDDYIKTLTLTGADKDALADEMERLAEELNAAFFIRDAGNVRAAQVLVLIGAEAGYRGLSEMCGFCYTQFTDVMQEMNGLFTFDRTPKFPLESMSRAIKGE